MAVAIALGSYAQSGTNSPYSQYGVGLLADQSAGFSRGMNGAGIALRQGNVVNTLNPASYASVDSLTMIFDLGVSGQLTNFKEGGKRLNAKNANFDYAVGSFRLFPNVGMAFGLLPYSNIGYKYNTQTYLDNTNGTITETYTGSGGLHQLFVGAGWRVTPRLSVGANVTYLWGTLDRSVTSSSTTYVNSLSRSYTASVNTYKVDLGLQWQQPLNNTDMLMLGATLGISHKLGADVSCKDINVTNKDTTTYTVPDGYAVPMTYGVGVAWSHANRLLVDADFTLQTWGKLDYPDIDANGKYALQSGLLKDRYQLRVGADFVPDAMGRKYFKRVHYRMGVGYATPYYTINGHDGPKELSVSAGFGLPLQNSYNNRSILNVSAQWVRTSAANMITENTFRINLGLTFNERWFAKWRID